MARHLGRGEALSTANPKLDTFIVAAGVLVDPIALSFEVLDVSDGAKLNAPVQVVPPAALDLVADRLTLGHFAARWAVPSDAALGRYLIVWRCVVADGQPELLWTRAFDVVGHAALVPQGVELLALVSDVRRELGAASQSADSWILDRISFASRQLVAWTGREFAPTRRTVTKDAPRGTALLFDLPIVAVESVSFAGAPLTATNYVVYNRHMRGGEDDRASPKVELALIPDNMSESRYFNRNAFIGFFDSAAGFGWAGLLTLSRAQQIEVVGVWGYLEPDGSPAWGTPAAATWVVVKIVLRELAKQGTGAAQTSRDAHLVTNMKTREQSIAFSRPTATQSAYAAHAMWTGDPAIDVAIAGLCRPLWGAIV